MAEEMDNIPQLQANMPPEARQNLMSPSESIQTVLMARLTEMTPEELRMLDAAITPDVVKVLMKLLPELAELIRAVESGSGQPEQAPEENLPADMGALGNV
jgi:hypothetical protein